MLRTLGAWAAFIYWWLYGSCHTYVPWGIMLYTCRCMHLAISCGHQSCMWFSLLYGCNIVLNRLAIGMCHMGTCPCAMNSGYYVMHCRFSRCFWPGTWGSTMWMYLELMCCCGIIHKLNVHFSKAPQCFVYPPWLWHLWWIYGAWCAGKSSLNHS